MSLSFCAILPTYDNPATLCAAVEGVRRHLSEVLVVDDGSGVPGREAAARLEQEGLARVKRLERNRGKGAAVKTGLRWARELGYTHALQVDADLQHDLSDIPRFLQAARDNPDALILGEPQFDDSASALRRRARLITRFWTDVETGGHLRN